MPDDRKPLHHYLTPATWPTWIGLGILRLLVLLPHATALAAGRAIGKLVHAVAGSRRAIVRRNIELCFPELTAEERNALAREHFGALGMSLIEMGLARWASDRHLVSMTVGVVSQAS